MFKNVPAVMVRFDSAVLLHVSWTSTPQALKQWVPHRSSCVLTAQQAPPFWTPSHMGPENTSKPRTP